MPKFTRRHYEFFAVTVKEIKDEKKRKKECRRLAIMFTKDNPRFNPKKWYSACNVPIPSKHARKG